MIAPGGVPLAAAVAGVAGALAAALWVDRRFGPRRGRGARGAALGVIALCLLGMVARPALPRAPSPAREVWLLTEGSGRAVDGGEVTIDPGADAWRLAGVPQLPGRSDPEAADVAAILRARPGVRRWRVVGYGLEGWQLAEIPGEIVPMAAPDPEPGVVDLDWARRLLPGEELVARGRVVAPEGEEWRLELAGPGGAEDSVELGAGESSFGLRARPRRVGRWLYRLRILASGETIWSAPIDLVVEEESPLRVLWLQAAPSFETRHLEPWLRRSGAKLAVRTVLSRGRFATELHNLDGLDAARLDRDLLTEFDLLVVDDATALGWGPERRRAVMEEIEEGGLGLLVLALDPASDRELAAWSGFALRTGGESSWRVRPRLPGLAEVPTLEIAPRELAGEGGAVRPLVADRTGRVLAAVRPRGAGRIALSLLADTYRWVLEGRSDAHRALWKSLLASVARPAASRERWTLPRGPILVDQPRVATWYGSLPANGAHRVVPGGTPVSLPLLQERLDAGAWQVVLRPAEEGWQRLGASGREAWFYAQPAAPWRGLLRGQRASATAIRALWGDPRPSRPVSEAGTAPVNRIWFLIGLLGAMAFLWVRYPPLDRAVDSERRPGPG